MSRRGPLIAAGAGALVVILVIALMVMPRVGQIHTTKDQLTAAQSQHASLEVQLTALKSTEAQAKAIRTQLALLDAAVPTVVQLPDLLRMLNDTADQSGVSFMSVNPGTPSTVSPVAAAPPASTDTTGATPSAPPAQETVPTTATGTNLPVGISIVPLSITIQGTYFAIDEYLFRLETLPRISKVTNVTLAGGDAYPQLVLTLSVNFYTTDTSAGPGSQPGAQSAGGAAPVVPGTGPSGVPSGSEPTPTGTLPG